MRMARMATRSGGFTLIELMIVVGIISLIAAIVVPQLAPVIAFSTNEGTARKLAGYGQSAMSRAQLMHEHLTVTIDLSNQEYWTMLQPAPPPVQPEFDDDDERGRDRERGGGGAGMADEEKMSPLELLEFARTSRDPDGATEQDQDKFNRQSEEMALQFDHMARRTLEAQAAHVKHDNEGMLADIGPEFDEFSLDGDREELLPEEVNEPLLQRTRLPDGVYIDSVRVGADVYTSDVVEILLSPIGLEARVAFLLRSHDGDEFTVQWDPIVGTGRVLPGEAFE